MYSLLLSYKMLLGHKYALLYFFFSKLPNILSVLLEELTLARAAWFGAGTQLL